MWPNTRTRRFITSPKLHLHRQVVTPEDFTKQPEINSKRATRTHGTKEKEKRGQSPPISYAAFWWLPSKFVAAFTAILPPHSCLTSCNVSHLPRRRGLPGCPRASARGRCVRWAGNFFTKGTCASIIRRSASRFRPIARASTFAVTSGKASFFRTAKRSLLFAIYSFLVPHSFPVRRDEEPTRESPLGPSLSTDFHLTLPRWTCFSVNEHDNPPVYYHHRLDTGMTLERIHELLAFGAGQRLITHARTLINNDAKSWSVARAQLYDHGGSG